MSKYRTPDRVYTFEEAEKLKGKMVACDEKECSGEKCASGGFNHKIPHTYDDIECFSSCCWPGHSGHCVLA